jgi:hypothetical protein
MRHHMNDAVRDWEKNSWLRVWYRRTLLCGNIGLQVGLSKFFCIDRRMIVAKYGFVLLVDVG